MKKKKPANSSERVLCLAGDGGRVVNMEARQRDEYPESKQSALELSRKWQVNPDVDSIISRKLAFCNYGLKIRPAGKKPDGFEEWLSEKKGLITNFIHDVWREWFTLDNVVAFWWDEAGYRAANPVRTLPPERCDYSDAMGIETLKFQHGLSTAQVAMLPENLKTRYRSSIITLNEEHGEHFRVMKRERTGYGFGMPRMRGIFRALAQYESMEVGENLVALASRLVVRRHKIGHEIRTGPRAGLATHFYKKPTAAAIKKFYEGRVGLVDVVTNFDQTQKLEWIDPVIYDSKKWDTVTQRILKWGGPVAVMLHATGVTPFLMPLWKTEALAERETVARFVEGIINNVFAPPEPVRLHWGNRCFSESRVAMDLLKFGVTQGAVSLRTFNEEAGQDHEEELERKQEELQHRDVLVPLWDAAHGSDPGKDGGRPPGASDPVE
jgi:hypothetical protein